MEKIVYIFGAIIFLLLPIYFWMYMYQSFSGQTSRKHFFFGMFLGGISSVLLVGQNFGISQILQKTFGIFLSENIPQNLGILFLFLSSFYIFYISIFGFVFFVFQKIFKRKFIFSFKFFIQLGFLLFFTFLLLIGVEIVFSKVSFSQELVFSGYNTKIFSVIIVYYFFVSLLEEGLKFLGNSFFSFEKQGNIIFFAISIALGFSFFENIFYAYHTFQYIGISGEWLQIVFFRSIFSLSLHIFCSLFLIFGYIKSSDFRLKHIKKFLIFGFSGIIIHSFFNISLLYGYVFIMFFIILGLYMFMSYILGQEE